MRLTVLILTILMLASSQRAQADIYPWHLGQNAEIEGNITDPVAVRVVLVSFTPGLAYPSFGYSLNAYLFRSQDSSGTGYSYGSYDVTVSADPNQPAGDIFFWTTIYVSGLPVQITDSARFLVSTPFFSRSFGGVGGDYTLGLELPSGLSVVGEQRIASVPEPSTWAMLLIGFAGIGFATYRRKSKRALMAT
jgi:hypothetical protein